MADESIRAVVLIPDGDDPRRGTWLEQCLRHCMARGYLVIGHATQWRDAAHMMLDGRAQVIVAADVEHFPPDRIPRIEAAGQPPTTPGPPRQRRPRDIGNQRDIGNHS